MTKTPFLPALLLIGACGSSADPADPQAARRRAADSVTVLDQAAA